MQLARVEMARAGKRKRKKGRKKNERKKKMRKGRIAFDELGGKNQNVITFPARSRDRIPLVLLAEIWVSALVRGN